MAAVYVWCSPTAGDSRSLFFPHCNMHLVQTRVHNVDEYPGGWWRPKWSQRVVEQCTHTKVFQCFHLISTLSVQFVTSPVCVLTWKLLWTTVPPAFSGEDMVRQITLLAMVMIINKESEEQKDAWSLLYLPVWHWSGICLCWDYGSQHTAVHWYIRIANTMREDSCTSIW